MPQLPVFQLFADGSCFPNPGPGGWAFLLRDSAGNELERFGGDGHTTNNRMEITGVIRGLEALDGPSVVTVTSDSQYVVNAMTSWMAKWKRYGWRKSINAREHVLNADLWRRLDELMQIHHVTAVWVRGHDGHPENERCDELANAAALAR